jgi:hypothetical protein
MIGPHRSMPNNYSYIRRPYKNLIQEEIKRRLNSGSGCYRSVQNLLSSRLLSKNLKMRIYKTIILPVVLYGCETWSLTLSEEHRLRVFENRVLRRICKHFNLSKEKDFESVGYLLTYVSLQVSCDVPRSSLTKSLGRFWKRD